MTFHYKSSGLFPLLKSCELFYNPTQSYQKEIFGDDFWDTSQHSGLKLSHFSVKIICPRAVLRVNTVVIILIPPYVVRDRDEARAVTEEFRARVDSVLRELNIEEHADEARHTVILQKPIT